jgi:hypothetical protein
VISTMYSTNSSGGGRRRFFFLTGFGLGSAAIG